VKNFDVIVAPDGSLRHIHDDELTSTLAPLVGAQQIERASHVEPTATLLQLPGATDCLIEQYKARENASLAEAVEYTQQLHATLWWADMRPSGGPILGPFEGREQALAAELVWLDQHNFGLSPLD